MSVSVDELVAKYVKVRDAKKAYKEKAVAELEQYDKAMKLLENVLLKQLDAIGAESVKTECGTAYKSLKRRYNMADWDTFIAMVKSNDAYFMLEHRVSQEGARQWEATNGAPPAGLNIYQEMTINVRR